MAILAAAMLPILSLQSQFVRSVAGFERADERNLARENALAYIKTVNFQRFPIGEEVFGGSKMTWQATPAGPPERVRGKGGDSGRFEVNIYDVIVTVEMPSGQKDEFSLRGLGWRPMRPAIDIFQ